VNPMDLRAAAPSSFLRHPGTVIAYGDHGPVPAQQFESQVANLATRLRARGERRWALVCDDSLNFAAGLQALLGARKTVVLPHAPQPVSVKAIQPAVDALLSDAPERFTAIPGLSTDAVADAAVASPGPDPDSHVEFYTSGSSGEPKRVVKTYGQLQTEVESLEDFWGARLGAAVILATVPHYHLYGLLFRVLWPLHAGRPLYRRTLLQPLELVEAGRRFPRTAVVSSPAFLTRVADFHADFPPRDRLAAVFSSGAPLPRVAAERAHAGLGLPVHEIYGSTETGGIAWRTCEPSGGDAGWQPLPRVETEVRAVDSAQLQLWVRSPWSAGAGWMPTGDLAERATDGRFTLKGRADTLVKLEDKRVSLAELSRWLAGHEWVAEARLTLVAGKRTVIGAAVVLNEAGRCALDAQGARTVRSALSQICLARYDAVLTPRKWRFVETLPVNAMGKITDAALQALFTRPA